MMENGLMVPGYQRSSPCALPTRNCFLSSSRVMSGAPAGHANALNFNVTTQW